MRHPSPWSARGRQELPGWMRAAGSSGLVQCHADRGHAPWPPRGGTQPRTARNGAAWPRWMQKMAGPSGPEGRRVWQGGEDIGGLAPICPLAYHSCYFIVLKIRATVLLSGRTVVLCIYPESRKILTSYRWLLPAFQGKRVLTIPNNCLYSLKTFGIKG